MTGALFLFYAVGIPITIGIYLQHKRLLRYSCMCFINKMLLFLAT